MPPSNGNGKSPVTTTPPLYTPPVDKAALGSNKPPVAVDDGGFATDNATDLSIATGKLSGNDTDPNLGKQGDALSVTKVENGTGGTVSLSGGNVVFDPDPAFTGNATFTYTVADKAGATDTGLVTVKVTAAPPPVVVAPPPPPPPTLPTLFFERYAADEGLTLPFKISLSGPTATGVTFDYATSNGTADSSDYTATSGSGFIPVTHPYDGTGRFTFVFVPTTHDTVDEPDETVVLTLSNIRGATAGPVTGTSTILDNDDPAPPAPAVTISLGDASSAEGGAISVPVTLSAAVDHAVTFVPVVRGGSATAGSDYGAFNSNNVVHAGQTSAIFVIPTVHDTAQEGDETILLALENVVGAAAGRTEATATIIDYVPAPPPPGTGTGTGGTIGVIPAVSVGPGGSHPEGSVFEFPVTLSAASEHTVTVRYDAAFTDLDDFVENTLNGTVTFAPGDTSETIFVRTIDDARWEGDEGFRVELSRPSGAVLASTGRSAEAVMVENDPVPPITASLDPLL